MERGWTLYRCDISLKRAVVYVGWVREGVVHWEPISNETSCCSSASNHVKGKEISSNLKDECATE